MVHVIVALCDNEHQGIVKVPAALGNGQDPDNNLYWGAMYGLRTFFRGEGGWRELLHEKSDSLTFPILEQSIFKSNVGGKPVYVIADAYDGANMADALRTFFDIAAGKNPPIIVFIDDNEFLAGSGADMLCFVGHNGLMDISLNELGDMPTSSSDRHPKFAVVLACKSAAYFDAPLRKAGCTPLVMTYGNMAPEAYTLDAIIKSWAADDPPAAIRLQAAQAYAKYQKCSLSAAEKLFGAR